MLDVREIAQGQQQYYDIDKCVAQLQSVQYRVSQMHNARPLSSATANPFFNAMLFQVTGAALRVKKIPSTSTKMKMCIFIL